MGRYCFPLTTYGLWVGTDDIEDLSEGKDSGEDADEPVVRQPPAQKMNNASARKAVFEKDEQKIFIFFLLFES